MNKYFWTWIMACVFYGLGIVVLAEANTMNILSLGYISGQAFQIGALLAALYTCNLMDNIPHNFFIVKYGVIFMGFFAVYIYYSGISPGVYVFMLAFKLIAVIITMYIILIKWKFPKSMKAAAIVVLGIGGLYLSIYDFLIYGSTKMTEVIFYLGLGMMMLLIENMLFAIFYRKRREAQEKLRTDYLANFAEKSADIIFYYNLYPYPRFSFVSPASRRLLDYTPEEFYNNSKLHVEIACEEDRQLMEELLSNFEGESRDCNLTVEAKSGRIVNLECMVSKIRNNGKVVAVEGVFRDITERLEAERKIKETNKNRQLMLSYISHDLKTPITYILGYSEAIEKGIIKAEDEKMNAVKSIINRTKSLAKLVDDISMLSKLEASKFSYEFEMIRCLELAERIRETHFDEFSVEGGYSMNDRNYKFIIEENIENEAFVLADVKRIEQVFENIFGNAVKATEEGGSIVVECGIDEEKSSFFVSVSDDGVGISEEDLQHIFENFYRSPQTKKRSKGSGLGLSLSHQLIKGHNGRIVAYSEPEKGSRFVFYIPLFSDFTV